MNRRHFVAGLAAAASGATLLSPVRLLGATNDRRAPLPRAPLSFPPEIAPDGVMLVANRHRAELAPGVHSDVWTIGDGAAAPTIRVRTGATARLVLQNQLTEPTILHWHGLGVPETADGHPRLAIGSGQSYAYEFTVNDRAGTYWYHAHPHMHAAEQVYRGMAGLFLVADAAEDALALPSGQREIPLLIQDRRADESGQLRYDPAMHEQMEGFFGDTPFGNGIRLPTLRIDTAWYRLRVVNGTNSRIIRLALSNSEPMLLIGSDGGLLRAPVTVRTLDLGTGERADLLIDFSRLPVGERVMLKSLGFASPATMAPMMSMPGMMSPGLAQGAELDLLEFEVSRAVREPAWVPNPFPAITRLAATDAKRTRTFRFASTMMNHTINGRRFEMDRIDETVRFGDTEVWSFINDGPFPHPVHMHEVQFQVLARAGGRGRVLPWETGWKDTVLVHPGERVDVITTFNQNRGRFLLHCHNLVHEDMGMMLNFEVV